MAGRRQALATKSVFVDSSVFFTAVNSPTGGSSKLFTIKNIDLMVSPLVLVETERNVKGKLHSYQLERFFKLVALTQVIDQKPALKLIKKARTIIAEKDSVILAEAKLAKCDFLVTLDKKHFLNEKVANFLKSTTAITPKDLIELVEGK